ncbi:MAG TPA: hypothetical protein DCF33_01620, partial [Saprospirales bacterium]|nr:hypothetical protein [Saprospirales bacterium]
MKSLILTLTLIGLLVGCTKETPIDPTGPTLPVDTATHIIELGKGSALRNGMPWNAAYSAHYYSNDRSRLFLFAKFKENGFDHSFSIDDISLYKNLQSIERPTLWNGNNGITEASYFVVLDEDQLFNSYKVDSTRTNQFIEILRYDSVEHIVEGRFQTFLEGPNSWSFLPDSMAITEGKFHL